MSAPAAYRLSCRDNSFPSLSHGGALQVIADLGLEGADITISGRHPHVRPEQVVADAERTAAEVAGRLDAAGLAVADVFLLDEVADAELWAATLAFAVALGAPGITVLPARARRDEDADAVAARTAADMQRAAVDAAEHGMGLSFEPHRPSVASDPARTLAVLEQAPDVGVTLDYSHFVAYDVAETDVDVLIPRTRHVQARQAAPGAVQAPARTGTIDFVRIVGALRAAGYQGWIGTEYVVADWMPEVDTLSQTALLRDLLRQA